MGYIVLPTRTSSDINSAADINQLMENIEYVKAQAENNNSVVTNEIDIMQAAYSEYYVVDSLRTSPNHGELNYLTSDNKLFKYNAITSSWVEIDWVNIVKATSEWIDNKLRISSGKLQISPDGTNWQDCYPTTSNYIKYNDTTKLYYNIYRNTNNTVLLDNCSYDYLLKVGETAIKTITNASSVQIKIKSEQGVYKITIIPTSPARGTSGGSTSSPTKLLINNTTYSNTVSFAGQLILYDGNGSGLGYNNSQNALIISHNLSPAFSISYVSTYTVNKSCITWASAYGITSNVVRTQWGTSASSDTTTEWTSLGTIEFPVSVTAIIIIERLK